MSSSKMQLKGRRPPPLAVRDESHKAQKPQRKAVVVYLVSPDVIHADASEFKALVQSLTGPSSLPAAVKSAGNPQQFPVRVKARGPKRSGGMSTGESLALVGTPPLSPSSPALPALFLHDLSPPCLWPGVAGDGVPIDE
ncbi:protein MKS1-like [Zingiber officinale]|uniref:VQ domain-containing protein n=1 Tax=Zingiber officinale TaxID=94328 RepID=A0A8J5G8N9_ZINOF|nr:protein MKS1-like [Zingiber officinale]XP_042404079.1 protein MKS1-like [Zingiber officinale]KAG6494688.1 hypothetical protein ZIOFF_042449 [Zingiber officinale]KAG6498643.1 hypothetical protein ZIOFF_038364 [Zingiber officinale]